MNPPLEIRAAFPPRPADAHKRSVGTVAVVGGSLCATAIGIFLIPVYYIIVEKISDALNKKQKAMVDDNG